MNELAQAKTFEQRMTDKMREHVGEMLTDDELKVMVNRTFEKVFFQGEVFTEYGRQTTKPALAEIMVRSALDMRVKEEIEKWAGSNSGSMERIVRELVEKGLSAALMKAVDNAFNMEFHQFVQQVVERIKRGW